MLVCGLDEAGRGSIVGPLVVGGVVIRQEAVEELVRLGVKDSKLLSPKRRFTLYDGIAETCQKFAALSIPPREVDRYVTRGKKLHRLNYLEAIYMARAVNRLGPNIVYADAADTNAARFSEDIRRNLTVKVTVIAEHHADLNYPVVSAASIIAKVKRDRAVATLRERYGDFGSGYPSDSRTIEFLKRWVAKEGQAPPFCRSSWKTWGRIDQRLLSDT
jgi:ribonuclease HII